MPDHGEQLSGRREMLQLKSAAQRRQLAAEIAAIDARFRGVDQGIAGVQRFLKRPAVLGGAAILGLVIGPKRILRLAGQGVLLVTAARRLVRFLRL